MIVTSPRMPRCKMLIPLIYVYIYFFFRYRAHKLHIWERDILNYVKSITICPEKNLILVAYQFRDRSYASVIFSISLYSAFTFPVRDNNIRWHLKTLGILIKTRYRTHRHSVLYERFCKTCKIKFSRRSLHAPTRRLIEDALEICAVKICWLKVYW